MAGGEQRWHWAPKELALSAGPEAGHWIADALRRDATEVGALVPPVFGPYARVFHPVYHVDNT